MDAVALPMFVKVTLSEEDCHCIVPILPLKVNTVLLVPEQTVAAPVMLPETEVELTVTVAYAELTTRQTPL